MKQTDEKLEEDLEIYENITELQKHLIPSSLLKRIYKADMKKEENVECTYEFPTS